MEFKLINYIFVYRDMYFGKLRYQRYQVAKSRVNIGVSVVTTVLQMR